MIFIAVTMGFFAESIRENINDRKKEREFVASLIGNLARDTTHFKAVIKENKRKLKGLDSLLSAEGAPGKANASRNLYHFYGGYVSYYSIFISHDATMLQLKNSGGLNYIKNLHVTDSIIYYDMIVRAIYAAEVPYRETIKDAIDEMAKILILRKINDSSFYKSPAIPLLAQDSGQLEILYNKISISKGWTENYLEKLERFYPFSVKLLELLKEEYDYESESMTVSGHPND